MNCRRAAALSALAALVVAVGCGIARFGRGGPAYPSLPASELPPLRPPEPLTATEQAMARIAWRYFENNTQPATGMVNSVNRYPSTTMWDLASYLGGLVSARELGVIDGAEFDRRLSALLTTLRSLDLFRGELPNKAYQTTTAMEANYDNSPAEIGFSAIDIGRLLIWLAILRENYPEHADAVDDVVVRWNFCRVLDLCGSMHGAVLSPDRRPHYLQEGRLGYEEYAAKGFQLWGFNTARASKPEPFATTYIYGVEIPYDSRDPRRFGAHNYVVSESFILDRIELGWTRFDEPGGAAAADVWLADTAPLIYRAQEERYRRRRIPTARTEHQLAQAPFFVYDTIFSDGVAWNTLTDQGAQVPQFAAVAYKAALGMWAIWRTDYSELLFREVADLADPERGFFEGRFENGSGKIGAFTANTNGIALETLLYKAKGPILHRGGRGGRWAEALADRLLVNMQCLPTPECNAATATAGGNGCCPGARMESR